MLKRVILLIFGKVSRVRNQDNMSYLLKKNQLIRGSIYLIKV